MSAGLRIQTGSLVSAMFFCFIHCFVRLLYHFRKICADGRISDGCSQRNITAAMMHSESRELFQQFLCQHGNSFFPGMADTDNFFTSVAIEGDVILEAEWGSKLPDCFQTFITGIMSPMYH